MYNIIKRGAWDLKYRVCDYKHRVVDITGGIWDVPTVHRHAGADSVF